VFDILQPTHLIFILLVALLVLGPKRLPEVGRSLGKGLRDFKSAMAGIEEQTSDIFHQPDVTVPPAVPDDVTAAALATETDAAPAFDAPTTIVEATPATVELTVAPEAPANPAN